MALKDADKENFQTLRDALRADRLVLVESMEVATGEYRSLVCAVSDVRDSPDEKQLVPIAVMIWDNPYEQFEDPMTYINGEAAQ